MGLMGEMGVGVIPETPKEKLWWVVGVTDGEKRL